MSSSLAWYWSSWTGRRSCRSSHILHWWRVQPKELKIQHWLLHEPGFWTGKSWHSRALYQGRTKRIENYRLFQVKTVKRLSNACLKRRPFPLLTALQKVTGRQHVGEKAHGNPKVTICSEQRVKIFSLWKHERRSYKTQVKSIPPPLR